MMRFDELIRARRSVRGYEAAPTREDLVKILETAKQAPSWKNWQTARSYVVESAEALEKVREALPGFNQNSSRTAALIVTTVVKDTVGFTNGAPDNEVGNGWGAYDLGIRYAYLVLGAADLGYDTLIMGLRDADALRRTLDIPEGEQVMSVIAVGKRAKAPVDKPRKALADTARFY